MLLSTKEKDEGARGQETVKVQLRSTLVSEFMHVCGLFFEVILMKVKCFRIQV